MSDVLVAAQEFIRAMERREVANSALSEAARGAEAARADFVVAHGRLSKLLGNKTRVIALGDGLAVVSKATACNAPSISVAHIEGVP